MMRRALAVAAVALLIGPPDLRAQAPKVDPDVAAGIRQVEEGDFDAAILTLDNAARRLAADPTRVRDLSQAYLYLGIAYVGKGHEAAAKAKFREAVSRIKDLSLSPDKFPPKVIDLFEAARDEASHAAPGPAAAAVKPSPAPPPASVKKGGGSGKTVLLVGLGGAAVAGVAVAAKGSGSSSPTGNTPNNNTPGANDTRTLDTFTGSLPNGEQRGFRVVVQGPGVLEAQITWPDPLAECGIILQEADPPYTTVANSRATSNTSAQLVANVTAKVYLVVANNYSGRGVLNFTLNVKHP